MQEMKGQAVTELTDKMKELQEEAASHFGKGRYIVPVQAEDNGIPLIKLKNGTVFQPLFTDILEFQKFNRENKFKAYGNRSSQGSSRCFQKRQMA